MYLFILSFLFSLSSPAEGSPAKAPQTAAIEATITTGNYGCGFLLRLSDGQLLKPQNLPKKFCKFGEKVVLVIDEIKPVYNSPCLVQKEVHIAAIHFYAPDPSLQAKY